MLKELQKTINLSGILGVRYRDNSLFVNAKETETNYDPKFADVQTFLTYKVSDKLDFNFLRKSSYQQIQLRTTNKANKFRYTSGSNCFISNL